MPAALVNSTVAASREKRLAEIEQHGLAHVRWLEEVRKAEHARIVAIRDFAGARGCPEIGDWLAFETNESAEAACARLSAFAGVYSTATN